MRKRLFFQLMSATTLAIAGSTAWAHGSAEATLHDLVERADAVVYGQVVDVTYRNSEPTENSPKGVPHTFVTYTLDKVMRGRVEGRTLTLKIPGGADGEGGFYNDTSAPQFAKGQTDVLFVSAANANGCPLVECVEGRFRVEDMRIYNGWGVPLVAAEKHLEFGGKPRFDLNVVDMPRPEFDSVIKRPEVMRLLRERGITTTEQMEKIRAEYNAQAPVSYKMRLSVADSSLKDDYVGEANAKPSKVYPAPMIMDEFFALIEMHNAHAEPPRQAVISANPKDRFKVVDPLAEAMTATVGTVNMSEEERLERAKNSSTEVKTTALRSTNIILQ